MLAPDKKLNSGYNIPVLGFATRNLTSGNAMAPMKTAIDSGCRHIDCASFHGNEKDIGIAMQRIIGSGAVRRNQLFLTSKYSPCDSPADNARDYVNRTLTDLQTDYLDLLLLQDPNNMVHSNRTSQSDPISPRTKSCDFVQIWKECEKLINEGLVRSIGVANFKEYHLEKILNESSVAPAVHQVNANTMDETQIEFCKKHNITISAYTSLRQRPSSTRSLVMDRSIVKEIASRHGKTTTQVNIRAHLQRGLVSVVESVKLAQIRSKFQIFDFELEDSEISAILALDGKQRHSSTDGQEVRLIDLIDEKPTINHRRWERGRMYSDALDS